MSDQSSFRPTALTGRPERMHVHATINLRAQRARTRLPNPKKLVAEALRQVTSSALLSTTAAPRRRSTPRRTKNIAGIFHLSFPRPQRAHERLDELTKSRPKPSAGEPG